MLSAIFNKHHRNYRLQFKATHFGGQMQLVGVVNLVISGNHLVNSAQVQNIRSQLLKMTAEFEG